MLGCCNSTMTWALHAKKAEMTKMEMAVNYNLHDWLIHFVSLGKLFKD